MRIGKSVWATILIVGSVSTPVLAQTAAEKNAARFLSKATFGADLEEIRDVVRLGHRRWVTQQLSLPPTLHQPFTRSVMDLTQRVTQETLEDFEAQGFSETELEEIEEYIHGVFYEIETRSRRYAWWQATMTAPDQLRQRVAFALSEIFVVSDRVEQLGNSPEALASYYDVLVRNSFGNYRDLLREVTLHPVMGIYLSHLNNAKADPSTDRFPDENYAREVMQLFSIGLHELRPNGKPRRARGVPIPTYTNREITEMAKIFTGLGPGASPYEYFDFGDEYFDLTVPMRMYEGFHEPGPKRLLRGLVVPAGQTGMEDIESAVDNLFEHPNVGPFIGQRLIQRLVTSNPKPAYVRRIGAVFNNNGEGVRGDLGAVVSAILLDPEARRMSSSRRDDFGHLQEPLLRYIQLLRAFGAHSQNGFFLETGYRLETMLRQHPLSAPSVFNFFLPDYQPIGILAERGLVAPEMQISNSATMVAMANMLEEILRDDYVMSVPYTGLICIERPQACRALFLCKDDACYEREIEKLSETPLASQVHDKALVHLDLDSSAALAAEDVNAWLDRIDLLLGQGRMSASTRRVLRDAISPLGDGFERVQLALYLAMLSPDIAVAN